MIQWVLLVERLSCVMMPVESMKSYLGTGHQ